MTYGALAAKVRALYGKRLRYADFERMAGMKSEAEILDYLRAHPGWSRAAGKFSPGAGAYVGRVEVEAALEEELRLEYLSLDCFVPRHDKPIMNFRVLLAERNAILNALRRLKAGKYAKGMPPPSSIVVHGKVDYPALSACADYEGVLDACSESIYYPVLLHLRPEQGGLPDFTVAESLLRSAYFSHMYRIVYKQYQGETQKVLLRAFGEQIDLLNIIHILRLKTYFPNTDMDTYLTVLFPFNYRLRPEFTRQLCAAPDADAVFALIRQSPYAVSFENVAVAEVEDYYRRAFYAFNRRQLITGRPCVYTAMSYLNLKESELRVLINVIESVKYGVPFDSDFAKLVGA